MSGISKPKQHWTMHCENSRMLQYLQSENEIILFTLVLNLRKMIFYEKLIDSIIDMMTHVKKNPTP